MVIVLGVDPGLKGGFAWLAHEAGSRPRLLRTEDMPTTRTSGGKLVVDAEGVAALMREMAHDVAVVEAVGPAPGQGAGSMFAFGRSLGLLEGAAAALDGRGATMVAPSVWKGALRLPGGASAKREAIGLARRLWPDVEIRGDGQAEAALIGAWWCMHAVQRLALKR